MNAPISRAEVQRLSGGYTTIADKARALLAAGYTISQTAKALDRSYQQIRQVVKNDQARAARGEQTESVAGAARRQAELVRPATTVFRLLVEDSGALTMPPALLQLAGLQPGDTAVAVVKDGRISLLSPQATMMRAQELVSALLPSADSLAESLLVDRRRDAAHEAADG